MKQTWTQWTMTLAATLALMGPLTGDVKAQSSDALLKKLVEKGILSQKESNDVREDLDRDAAAGIELHNKMKVGGWLDELTLGGDMRARYETFWGRQLPSATGTYDEVDRTRYRLRLRVGLVAKAGDWTAGLRLASGDTGGPAADAISTNTTFDQFAGKKPINLDLAYLAYEPNEVPGLKVTVGKMENPFWETDMVYDFDLTPEGMAEQYTRVMDDNFTFFANMGQWVLAEDNITQNNGIVSRGRDAFMLGEQVGYQWKAVPGQLEWKQALSYYDYLGIRDQAATAANTFTSSVIRNTLTTTPSGTVVWAKDYQVLALNQEMKIGYMQKLPITLQGEYINNLATKQFSQGFKVGGRLWEAKKKGQYEVGYWYEWLSADATQSLFSDSDFGAGGTNGKGHIVKARYQLTDWASISMAYWFVENVDDFVQASGAGTPGAGTAANNQMRVDNRLQLDVSMKF